MVVAQDVRGCGDSRWPAYLLAPAALRASGLPEYFAAVNGITAAGTPVCAAATFVAGVASVATTGKTRHSTLVPTAERH